MKLSRFVLCAAVLGLLLNSSSVYAKELPKPIRGILKQCPCWVVEGGWEEHFWLIDEQPPQYHIYAYNLEAGVISSIMNGPDGGICFTDTLFILSSRCQVNEGVVSGTECAYGPWINIFYLTDKEMAACHRALQEMSKRAMQFE